jgi:hypothetical protein
VFEKWSIERIACTISPTNNIFGRISDNSISYEFDGDIRSASAYIQNGGAL